MSFLIRAALVIGALSWLALQRQDALGPEPAASRNHSALAEAALAAWETVPDPARETMLREGGAEIVRRMVAAVQAGTPSRDTLLESDRKLPWRGTQMRADADRLIPRGERPNP
ncbi:hypothetical protein [Methylobacterium sp. J-068]|uniref:hypothetical protein n=1 Tax=Methylobacterium sp. J-068 TaxID=2836649 RepID=UPI001FBA5982|nr:hypothetical protein [Methylobacterium sp. J-068]MCJ2032692.1 hypothetical protein [Methylobacterium sp. J-068]